MASFNVSLSNATFYGVTKFDIVKGEQFTIYLMDSVAVPEDWFFNNDAVLSSNTTGSQSQVTASELGVSKLRVLDASGATEIMLDINVIEEIVPPAVALNSALNGVSPK
jgi:hypothetical protein